MVCSNFLMAQHEEVYLNCDKWGYKHIAKERFIDLYSKEKSNNIPVFSTTLLSDKYGVEELDFISVPILRWNQGIYKCGDDLEPLINFKEDFLFQKVFIVTKKNNLRVGTFEIFDSFHKENQKKDSLNNVLFPLHGRPVMSDSKEIEGDIHKYILDNPNVFVFMIKGLHGYWAVIEGKIVKLLYKRHKIKKESISKYACERYGQEFINDAITDSFRIGYKYLSCSDCKKSESLKINIIERLNIKEDIVALEKRIDELVKKDPKLKNIQGIKQFHILLLY